jgi:hypothetical protein
MTYLNENTEPTDDFKKIWDKGIAEQQKHPLDPSIDLQIDSDGFEAHISVNIPLGKNTKRKEQHDQYHHMTQKEVAVELGVTRAMVSKIERDALEKLRRRLSQYYFKQDWL